MISAPILGGDDAASGEAGAGCAGVAVITNGNEDASRWDLGKPGDMYSLTVMVQFGCQVEIAIKEMPLDRKSVV